MDDEMKWDQEGTDENTPETSADSEQPDSGRTNGEYSYTGAQLSHREYSFAGSEPEPEKKTEEEVPPETPKYAHYEMHHAAPEISDNASSKRREKKTEGTVKGKFALTVALAVVFGLVAGLVFQGVNMASDRYRRQQIPIAVTETLTGSSGDEEAGEEEQDLSEIVAESGTVAGVAQAAIPCVVAITSISIQEIPSFFGYGFGYGFQEYPSTGSGSGIIVGENDEELLIATNNHVVEGATTLSVCFIGNDVVNAEAETQNLASGDGDINVEDAVSAKIKGTDSDNDLAVVAVMKKDIPEDTLQQIKIAQLGNSENLVVGEQVVAIGNALGYGQSVTSGWISALDREVIMEDGRGSELIQTDAAINPGNSGGALLNMRGELIGINSAKYADNAVEGMGYAIPISKAKPILEELMNRKTRDKVDKNKAAQLGVQVADLTSEAIQMYNMPAGAFVIEVTSGGAAEQAGIQKGDIIVKLDGQKVSGKDDLVDKLLYYEAGEKVEIVIARADNGEYVENTLEVKLDAKKTS